MDNKYTVIIYPASKVIVISRLRGVKEIAGTVKQLNSVWSSPIIKARE